MTRGNQRDTDRLRAQQRAAGGAGTGKSTLGTAESTAAIMRAKQEAAMAKKAAEAAGKQPENGQVVGLKEKKAPTSEADAAAKKAAKEKKKAAAMAAAAAAAVGAQAAGLPPPHQMNLPGGVPSPRAHTCTRADSLRAVVEALALPGVRRLVAVDAATGVVEGVVSLSDVVAFLLAS